MNTPLLYVVGIGPGDPELLTLKAVRLLKETPCVIVPKGSQEGSSLALSIAQSAVDLSQKETIEVHFPMVKTKDTGTSTELNAKWSDASETILNALRKHSQVVFITLGDPSIYSTFFYVYKRLTSKMVDLVVKFIPGVSSINASACEASVPLTLGDEKMVVIPATYADEQITSLLQDCDTLVLMKTHRVFDRIVALLEKHGLLEKAIYVCRAGMKDQKILKDLRMVKETDLDYFSMIIVRKKL